MGIFIVVHLSAQSAIKVMLCNIYFTFQNTKIFAVAVGAALMGAVRVLSRCGDFADFNSHYVFGPLLDNEQ